MVKQLLIMLAFLLTGSWLIALVCIAFVPQPYTLVVSGIVGMVFGFYVSKKAVASGAFNG